MPRFAASLSARPAAQSSAPLNLSTAHDPDLLQFVERISGQDVRACYQCGKCAAGCPLAPAMDLPPQQVIRALQLGQPDLALDSDTLWLCVSCQTCVTRCPCEVDLPRLMDALRVWAIARGRLPAQREIAQFHRVFLILKELAKLGFQPEQVITTLESKMKCGLGKCGRCNVGDQYVCQDGPVFRYDQIQHFLEAF